MRHAILFVVNLVPHAVRRMYTLIRTFSGSALLPLTWRITLQRYVDDEFRADQMPMNAELGAGLRYQGVNDPHAEA